MNWKKKVLCEVYDINICNWKTQMQRHLKRKTNHKQYRDVAVRVSVMLPSKFYLRECIRVLMKRQGFGLLHSHRWVMEPFPILTLLRSIQSGMSPIIVLKGSL